MSKLKELEIIFDNYNIEYEKVGDTTVFNSPEQKLEYQKLKGKYMAEIYFMLQQEKLNGVYDAAGTLVIAGHTLNEDQVKALQPRIQELETQLEGRKKSE